MSQKSSFYRTYEILKMLNEGKKVCVNSLSLQYDVSDRTIRRDFELIKDLFGNFLTKEGDCYKAYKKFLLDEVLSAHDLMNLANIIALFGEVNTKNSISNNTKELIKTSSNVYDFKSKPFENIKNKKTIKELEYAIKFNKEIQFDYIVERTHLKKLFNSYKIIFLNENFYLAGENTKEERFEILRVSFICNVKHSKKTFYVKKDISDFINDMQTPWAMFGAKKTTVKVRVNKKNRRHFLQKKYLPSQKVLQTFENGDIEVSYLVTNYREIEELILKWLPNIKILEPNIFKTMAKKSLKKKLASL